MVQSSQQQLLTPLVRELPATTPFVGPEALQRRGGVVITARLGANESAFGPSPRVIDAMRAALDENWMYADPESWDLRHALSSHHNVDAGNVVIGEGIDGLLGLTVQLTVSPGEAVVTSDGAYPTFNFHVAQHGGQLIKVPFRDDREDLEGLLHAAQCTRAKIIYVSNPNNPMGSWWPAEEINDFCDNLPAGCLLVLDEAYCELAPDDAVPRIDASNPSVLRFRTFSKVYGMAGARIGYAVGERDMIAAFEKVRNHYGINRVGQVGALAAVRDQAYVQDVVGQIARARGRLSEIASRHGLVALESATNFVAIDCGRDGAYARAIVDGLLEEGVFIRQPGVAPLNRCIRVSAAPDDELSVFDRALGKVLDGLK